MLDQRALAWGQPVLLARSLLHEAGAAVEAVTMLPPRPSGKYGRTLARLYTLVGKTAGRASVALERGEELAALRAAQLAAQVSKRSPARRAR